MCFDRVQTNCFVLLRVVHAKPTSLQSNGVPYTPFLPPYLLYSNTATLPLTSFSLKTFVAGQEPSCTCTEGSAVDARISYQGARRGLSRLAPTVGKWLSHSSFAVPASTGWWRGGQP